MRSLAAKMQPLRKLFGRRHALSRVRAEQGHAILMLSLLAFALLFAATHAAAKTTPRFEASACPKPPKPIASLKNARCGFLIVPENRSDPNGRKIRLAVAIVPSRTKPALPDPIVFMAGGPGEAAILDTPFLVEAGINRNRDVIIMNQRGTLYDDPDLNCPEIDRFYARQVSMLYDAPSTGKAQAAAAAACHDRLVAQHIDLSAYNTTENAQDFADLREMLGIRQWNVYGYSYGSDLALTLMRDHPEGIRSAIIDSIVPPDVTSLPWTWSSAAEGIENVFNDCQAQSKCASKYPNLLTTFTSLVQRLEAHPIVRNVVPPGGKTPVKVVLDGGTILNMAVSNNPKAADLPRAITQLAHGNATIFLQTRAAGAHVADVTEQAQGMTQSLMCREWTPFGSSAAILHAGQAEFPTLPETVLINAPQLPFEHELCKEWDVPAAPESHRVRVRSSIPTLVVSGDIDSKTGARWGQYAADTLPHSTYIQIRNVAHWVVVQSPCAQKVFQSFLATPRSPKTSCVASVPGVDFK
jgi:pimeloyl-ACP methyl ester carboxylesterase